MTTLAEAQAMLAKYLAAESALTEGKEVRFSQVAGGADRMWRSEDLPQIRAGRREWEQRVAALQAGASGAPRIGGLGFGVASFGPGERQ